MRKKNTCTLSYNSFGNEQQNCVTLQHIDNQNNMNLLSIDELFDKYPQIKSEMKWTKEDIHTFYETTLLTGKVDKTTNELKVTQENFEKLIEFYKSTSIAQKEFDQQLHIKKK